MNLGDIIIIVILVAALLGGLQRGFIVQVAYLLGAVVAFAVAKLEFHVVRTVLEQFAAKSPWLTVISYLIVFLVVWAAIVAIAERLRSLARWLLMGGFDRLGGAILGLLQGAAVVELLLYLGKRVPSSSIHNLIKHSKLAAGFLNVVPYINHFFPHVPTH